MHSEDKHPLQSSILATVHSSTTSGRQDKGEGEGTISTSAPENKHHLAGPPSTSCNPRPSTISFIRHCEAWASIFPSLPLIVIIGVTSASVWVILHQSLMSHRQVTPLLISSSLHLSHPTSAIQMTGHPQVDSTLPPETMAFSNLKYWKHHILRPQVLS